MSFAVNSSYFAKTSKIFIWFLLRRGRLTFLATLLPLKEEGASVNIYLADKNIELNTESEQFLNRLGFHGVLNCRGRLIFGLLSLDARAG
jgi:hypothetical protein